MEYQLPATSVETGAMPGAPYVVSQPMAMDGAYMTGAPYTTYGGYSMSPYMPAMPAVGGLDHSQGKWFAPGEALPPGYVITAHPEGHSAPQEGHAMSEMASASFVIPASSAAAAVKTGSAVKSKKSKKKKSSGCCWDGWCLQEHTLLCDYALISTENNMPMVHSDNRDPWSTRRVLHGHLWREKLRDDWAKMWKKK